jgi:hypothetical protein
MRSDGATPPQAWTRKRRRTAEGEIEVTVVVIVGPAYGAGGDTNQTEVAFLEVPAAKVLADARDGRCRCAIGGLARDG